MALALATDRRLDASGLEALVRAILAAPEGEPETDSLEWKRTLELAGRRARFQLARTLLAFGNRTVAQAQGAFEGYAYLVAGVEPGRLVGVSLPDPAELENALHGFVAHGHPSWRLHRVDLEDRTVAVIEAAPPRAGDRICCLQTTYDNVAVGRVFVRRQGQTIEAPPEAIRALEERFAAAAVALQQQAHTLAAEQLTLQRQREARDELDRAQREAPRFASGRIGDGFAHVEPHQLQGIVRNVGGVAATIVSTRLLLDPSGAYPGAGVPVYGQGPAGDFGLPIRIDKGVHVLLRYANVNLQALTHSEAVLTIELEFESDSALRWRQLLVLRRHGADQYGRRRWTVREAESEQELTATP